MGSRARGVTLIRSTQHQNEETQNSMDY